MQSQMVALLYKLQQVEQRLTALERLRQKAPEARVVQELARREEQFIKLQAVVKKRLQTSQKRLRAAELELAAEEEAVKKVNDRLYGGEATNAKELAQLQERLENLKDSVAQHEGNVYACLEQIETLEDQLAKVTAGAAKNAQQLEAAKARLAHKESEWDLEADLLRDELDELLEQIPPDLMTLYERKKATTSQKPVALVQKGVCQGCQMELPSFLRSVRGRELSTCEQCGRILYWPE